MKTRRTMFLSMLVLPVLIIAAVAAIGFGEGAFDVEKWKHGEDAPLRLGCDGGQLSNRNISFPAHQDREYNWLLVRGQRVTIHVSTLSGSGVDIFFAGVNLQATKELDYNLRIQQTGMYTFEMQNGAVDSVINLNIYAETQPLGNVFTCLLNNGVIGQ